MKVFKEYQVSGTPEQLIAFRDRLVGQKPAQWEHSSRFESIVNGTYESFTVPRSGDTPAATVALFLSKSGTSAKVVNVVPNESRSLTMRQYNDVLKEFVSFATPIARNLDLEISETGEDAKITRWISKDAEEALLGFSNAANKSTGSAHPMDFDRWARFIIRIHREKGRLPSDLLGRYLVEELGWQEEKAHDLMLEYEFGLALLKVSDNLF